MLILLVEYVKKRKELYSAEVLIFMSLLVGGLLPEISECIMCDLEKMWW